MKNFISFGNPPKNSTTARTRESMVAFESERYAPREKPNNPIRSGSTCGWRATKLTESQCFHPQWKMPKDSVTVGLACASTIEIVEHIHGKSVRGKKFRRVRHDGVTSSRAMQPDDRGKFISIGGGEKTVQSNFLSAGIKAHSRLSHEVGQKFGSKWRLGGANLLCKSGFNAAALLHHQTTSAAIPHRAHAQFPFR